MVCMGPINEMQSCKKGVVGLSGWASQSVWTSDLTDSYCMTKYITFFKYCLFQILNFK